ncbi:MAG: Ig-like domain-containing protein [Lachnospiraceae bacterium]|nr:Ig-like domain-containing protein [Lachnospiraceae bacterium]
MRIKTWKDWTKLILFTVAAVCLLTVGVNQSVWYIEALETIPVSSVTLSQGAQVLAVTKQITIEATVLPENASRKALKWESSNPAVASVSSGKVTAKNPGTAVISATAADGSGATASRTIQVTPIVTHVSILKDGEEVNGQQLPMGTNASFGESITLTSTNTPDTSYQRVNWSCSNPEVLDMEVSGQDCILNVTGVNGTATITAVAADGSSKWGSVVINAITMVEDMQIEGDDYIGGGKNKFYTTVASPENATDKSVKWEVVDPDTGEKSENATITNGKLVAGKVSETTVVQIRALCQDGSGFVATKDVTITPSVTSIKILKDGEVVSNKKIHTNTHDMDDGFRLEAVCDPEESRQEVVWSTDNSAVATVDEDGNVTTHGKKGSAQITATATDGSGKFVSTTVVATAYVSEIEITGNGQVAGGRWLYLDAEVLPEDVSSKQMDWTWYVEGDPDVDPNLVYLAQDPTDSTKCIAKTREVRHTIEVTVVATARDRSGISAEKTFQINPVADSVEIHAYLPDENGVPVDTNVTKQKLGIDINPNFDNLDLTRQLEALVESDEASQEVVWSTSNDEVAGVDENGLVTARGIRGTAKITAKVNDGTSRSAAVYINCANMMHELTILGPLETTENVQDEISIGIGKVLQLTTAYAPSNATSKGVVWSVDQEAYASVSEDGRVSASKNLIRERTVTVTATAKDGSGVFATKRIHIVPAVTSVSIYHGSERVNGTKIGVDTVNDNEEIQLSAALLPETSYHGVIWKSSNTRVATVDENGLVTTQGQKGTARITATSVDGSGKSGSVTIRVYTFVQSISVTGITSVAAGKSTQLTAAVLPTDAATKGIDWVSADTEKAIVSTTGKVTARKLTERTTVDILAKAKDESGVVQRTTITIYPAATAVSMRMGGNEVGGTSVTYALSQMPEGTTIQLSASVLPETAMREVTWQSTNRKVATVDENGLVTFMGVKGTTRIKAIAADGTKKKVSFAISVVLNAP